MNGHIATTVLLFVSFSSAAAAQTARGFAGVSAGLQSGSKSFSYSASLESPLFGPEAGALSAHHPGGNDTLVDFAAGVRIVGQFGVGAGVSLLSRSNTVDFTARLPHPFHFDRFRQLEGMQHGANREEVAIHVSPRWTIPVNEVVEIALFGGPTFFRISQELVTGVDFTQKYPHDTATLRRASVQEYDGSAVGFNVGADVAVYFSRWIGVGGVIRFSRAESNPGERPTTITAGGLHAAGGLRLRF